MSAISFSFSRKRRYSPEFRDDENLPRKKKRGDAQELPDSLKAKLKTITDWFLELKHVNKFARMAFKSGTAILEAKPVTILDDDDEDDDDEDDVVITDDDEDEIQEIKRENGNQEKLPLLVNGSSLLGSHCNSLRQNGARSRDLSTRLHGKTTCCLQREPVDKLKRKPLVSNPPSEIEVLLGGDEPAVVVVEGDGIEIISESPSSKQKSANSKKSLHISVKSSKSSPPAVKQDQSAPIKQSLPLSKLYTANEVVRLQEKAQYKLLLEKYINGPQRYHTMGSESAKEIQEDSAVFSGKHFKKQILEQPVRSFFEKYYTPCRLLPSKKSSEMKDETPEITIDDDDEDDEIQVIEMKKSTYTSVFNSQLFTNSWLSELQQNVRAQNTETNKIVEDYERQIEKYKAERLLRRLKIQDVPTKTELEFPELTLEMEEVIDKVLAKSSPNELVNETANGEIRKKDIDTLIHLNWLNDQIMNAYFDLIVERNKEKGYPTVYAFTTYFYGKLKQYGYSSVKRWTRRVDIFSFDILFIPMHLSYHWCLGVIDNRKKKIYYYDSMGTSEEDCLTMFLEYLCLEHKDKKGVELDRSVYSLETMRNIPQQMNGSDCGMFTLKYAEYLSRNAEITFNQSHMVYFRRRAMYELITKHLL